MTDRFPHTTTNTLITASAGSGKTFQLSNRYLKLLLAGVPPDHILATTFTRKAAGEILERILGRLAKAATDEKTATDLAGELAGTSDATSQDRPARTIASDEAAGLLHDFVADLHQVRVGTLDAFFARIGQSYAMELGLPPGWRIANDAELTAMKLRAIDRTLAGLDDSEATELLTMLDKGSTRRGITRNLVAVIDTLREATLEAERNAWDWIENSKANRVRLRSALPEAIRHLAAVTLKPGFRKVVDQWCERATGEDWTTRELKGRLPATVVAKAFEYNRSTIDEAVHEPLEVLFGHVVAVELDRLHNSGLAVAELLSKFERHFANEKAATRTLEFSDLPAAIAAVVEGDGEGGDFTYRLDASFHHVLFDEFQDTSPVQWRVLEPLAERAGGRSDGSVLCVGDPKQAIYGWRGGVAEVFDSFADSIADLEEQPLDASWRSSQPVIDAVNAVFSQVDRVDGSFPGRAALAQWLEKTHVEHTTMTDLEGHVVLRTTPSFKTGNSTNHAARRQYLADEIATLHRQRPDAEIGVLVSRNDELVGLSAALRAHADQLFVSEEGRGGTIGDAAAIDQIRALLTLAVHPGDGEARYLLAHPPLNDRIGLARSDDDEAAATLSLQLRRELAAGSLPDVLRNWSSYLLDRCTPRDRRRLQQVVQLAEDAVAGGNPTVDEFLDLLEVTKRSEPSSASIRVMTVHASKGLEFDIVVLPDLDQPLAKPDRRKLAASRPSPTAKADRLVRYCNKDLLPLLPDAVRELHDEDARLQVREGLCKLYVAMTRAKHTLHMFIPPSKDGAAFESDDKIPKLADVLRCTLPPSSHAPEATELFTGGTPEWTLKPEETATAVSVAKPIDLATEGATRWSRTRRSPSGFEEVGGNFRGSDETTDPVSHESDARWTQRLARVPATQRTERGTLLHRFFEEIEWIGDGVPSDESLQWFANTVDADPTLAATAIEDFRSVLQCEAIRSLLSRPSDEAAVVLREQAFAVPWPLDATEADELLTGAIDRLVVFGKGDDRRAELIDWKTNRVETPASLDGTVAHYLPQMAAYRLAASRILNLSVDRIAVRLVLLGPARVVDVSGDDLAAIEPRLSIPRSSESDLAEDRRDETTQSPLR